LTVCSIHLLLVVGYLSYVWKERLPGEGASLQAGAGFPAERTAGGEGCGEDAEDTVEGLREMTPELRR